MMTRGKRRKVLLAALVVLAAFAAMAGGCGNNAGNAGNYAETVADIADSFPIQAEPAGVNPQLIDSAGPYAILHTTAGDITILLYPRQAPKAVENFIALAKAGYYDKTLFHYAKRGELTQTGRPADAEKAETSIWEEPFADEFDNGLYHFKGAVGMAGDGNNNNLSQFYLLVQDTVPEDERIVPASFYMNELMAMRVGELNERSREAAPDEAELQQFEDDLNGEIQAIGTEGVPAEYRKKYEAAAQQYQTVGGAWSLDYHYTVFGQIVEGFNVAEAITQVKVEAATRKPKKDVVIESIEIRE